MSGVTMTRMGQDVLVRSFEARKLRVSDSVKESVKQSTDC